MLGLRTQETNKFILFFELVQEKAKEKESVFFLDSGDGKEFETEAMEGENLQGWLVPLSKVDEFEKIWKDHKENDEYVDFYCWAEWFDNKGKIDIKFMKE
ncbi:hypothetical protein DWY90_09910 [Coprococcus sp. AF27-8]|nr:hypothetical protein DWY90_09910 [Coprococcus sp. AF27-8]DAX06627.1 MAG TPA: hypothetical protein [Bacteriophage sp.]